MSDGGVYRITCLVNGRFYIGSSCKLQIRKRDHFTDLRLNKHPNSRLQRAYNKYGEKNFVFDILEIVQEKSRLIEREQYYLDTLLFAQDFILKLNSVFKQTGFNLNPTASSTLGFRFSTEQKKRIGDVLRGRKNGPQSRETILKKSGKNHWTTRKRLTSESVEQIKQSLAEYYVKNTSINKGKPKSEDHKRKISNSLKGKLCRTQ